MSVLHSHTRQAGLLTNLLALSLLTLPLPTHANEGVESTRQLLLSSSTACPTGSVIESAESLSKPLITS
ncbi:MAG TPA: hypothetical protein DEH10_03480 [Pseudomonas sp.]|nr:hypothetical protein [Pseudomonas sp.]